MCADGIDRSDCPPSQFDNVEDGQVVRQVASEVAQWSRRVRLIEVALVALMTAGILFLVGADFADRKQDRERLEKGNAFALNAVQCIVGHLVDHRVADRAIHDEVLRATVGKRSAEVIPSEIVGDPLFPAGEELERACERFQQAVRDGGRIPP